MIPMNPRELQRQLRQLKKLGMKIEQIDNVKRASIELNDKRLVIESPEVFVVEFGGQKMFYITAQSILEEPIALQQPLGTESARGPVSVTDDDVRFVAEYTGVTIEEAREAIMKTGGDIAKAIEIIQSKKRE